MASIPKFVLRDGSGTAQDIVLTTNQLAIQLEGVIDPSTADMQISVNGGSFSSDPELISIVRETFVIPNPSANPDGLPLDPGQNVIKVRAIDVMGGVSAAASAVVTRVQDIEESLEFVPTGIRVKRRRDSVDILIAKTKSVTGSLGMETQEQPLLKGFNVYASSTAGGVTGYFKVNDKPVLQDVTYEEDVSTIDTESTTWDGIQMPVRVAVTEEDDFGNTLGVRLSTIKDTFPYASKLRFSSTLESVTLNEFVWFRHNREGGTNIVNSDQFVDVPAASPLYYVVTGIYWMPETNTEFETPFSQEVLGTPFTIDTNIRDLPGKSRTQIVVDYITQVQRVNQKISLIPGSTTRDVSIDPFSSEAERIWFLLDFVHRSQSFLTLMQIDDANGDGESDDVATSAYKQALKSALGVTIDSSVQKLIDTQFDKLAANFDKPRLPGRPAIGQAVYYTTNKPTKDIVIPSGTIVSTNADSENGIPSVQFRVGGTYILPLSNADAFYNYDTKQWEIVVDVVATSTGSAGNRPAGQLVNSSGIAGMLVTNTEATVFGTDIESNHDLALRAMLGFSSVDTGTEGGYAMTAASQIGVIKSRIVKSGDDLMMRDWDPIRLKHAGGKVDIWIQGSRERQTSDRFSFTFEVAKDIRCQVLDPTNLVFRVLDPRVTVNTPIVEVLNDPAKGLGVRNVTLGEDYDLTGVQIVDYQTFSLDPTLVQPVTMFDDIVTADFRFRIVHTFVFTLQPVRRIVSVVGEVSGALVPDTGYKLFKSEDPLLEGESTIASDYMSVYQVNGIPSGATLTVNDEQHIMVGFVEEPLDSIGINTKTLRVFSEDRTVEFNGIDSLTPDYSIIEGTATKPIKIVRTTNSTIANGQVVSVDYTHDENFVVTYVINDLLQELQRTLDAKRHTTADVLAKQAVQNSVNIETSIQLAQGAKKDTVDPMLRTNVSLALNKRYIGQGIGQDDIIHAVKSTSGVYFQVTPMTTMAYADGAQKLRESLYSAFQLLPSLSIGGNRAFILTGPLEYPTTDNGGYDTEHRAVFQDSISMTLAPVLTQVALKPDQAFIIGSVGATIDGWTDDATLIADGFLTPESRQAERLRRTANHVVVSLLGTAVPPDEPTNHEYAVSYVVRGDTGTHDISASSVEFLNLGNLTVTYKET